MKFRDYIKDKILLIVTTIIAVVTVEILLLIYDVGIIAKIYIAGIIILSAGISIIAEYIKKRSYYNMLKNNLDELEEKYLISEIIKTPNFTEGKILKEVLEEADRAMIEQVKYYKNIRRRL